MIIDRKTKEESYFMTHENYMNSYFGARKLRFMETHSHAGCWLTVSVFMTQGWRWIDAVGKEWLPSWDAACLTLYRQVFLALSQTPQKEKKNPSTFMGKNPPNLRLTLAPLRVFFWRDPRLSCQNLPVLRTQVFFELRAVFLPPGNFVFTWFPANVIFKPMLDDEETFPTLRGMP